MAKTLQNKIVQVKNQLSMIFQSLSKYQKKFDSFKQKFKINIDKGDFIIKTAETGEELKKAMTLRHDVFYEELLHRHESFGLDMDRFDFICDHLMIIEKKTGTLIGTYRLNSSLITRKFYTATEFKMKNIAKLPGNKLELGRACIDKNHRNGITIALLWTGIAEYMKITDTRFLFGCSSVKTTDPDEIAMVTKFLMDKYGPKKFQKARPRKKFRVPGLKKILKFYENNENYDKRLARKKVPSLLKSYLNLGGVVCGKPALDVDFQCIDFLTLVDVKTIKVSVLKKFGAC